MRRSARIQLPPVECHHMGKFMVPNPEDCEGLQEVWLFIMSVSAGSMLASSFCCGVCWKVETGVGTQMQTTHDRLTSEIY